MRASELIRTLQKTIEENGDWEVCRPPLEGEMAFRPITDVTACGYDELLILRTDE